MDNKNNIEQFDELFKQAFDGASANVPPSVWQGVSSATSSSVATSTSVLSKLLGVKGAAILGGAAIVVTSIVMLTAKDSKEVVTAPENEQVVQQQTVVEESRNEGLPETAFAEVDELGNVERIKTDNLVLETKVTENELGGNSSDVVGQGADSDPMHGIGDDSPVAGNITPSTNQENGNEEVKSSNVKLWCSTQTCCLNQSVDFEIKAELKPIQVIWELDGKRIGFRDVTSARILFEKSGRHQIRVKGIAQDNTPFEMNKEVRVGAANAGFMVEPNPNGFVLSASSNWVRNQWYVNQVMIQENQASIDVVGKANEKYAFVHIAVDENGCSDTARQQAVIESPCNASIEVPDIFTPYLMDGKNDLFELEIPEVEKFWLSVYGSTNGEVVFETQNAKDFWNGKRFNQGELLPVGWYTYQLVYVCGGKTKKKSGKVLLAE